jgi:hypothetical protein
VFVGGVSDGIGGAAAMPLVSNGLAILKSWFFVDDGFVALGANLTLAPRTRAGLREDSKDDNKAARSVVTTVDVRRLDGHLVVYNGTHTIDQLWPGVHHFGAKFEWAWHSGIGYTNMNTNGSGVGFTVYNTNRTGNWSSLGTHTGTVTMPVFELGVDHAVPTSSAAR